MTNSDRRSFDTAASGQVQGDLQGLVARLESLINDRDRAVQSAMSDFQADGVSDQYAAVEKRWQNAAGEVRTIISLVKSTLGKNDETAGQTLSQAKNAVSAIG